MCTDKQSGAGAKICHLRAPLVWIKNGDVIFPMSRQVASRAQSCAAGQLSAPRLLCCTSAAKGRLDDNGLLRTWQEPAASCEDSKEGKHTCTRTSNRQLQGQ